MAKQVVLKFGAFSNITYNMEYETGYSPAEWADLSEKEKDELYAEAVWSDIDAWEDVVGEDDEDEDE